MEIPGTTTRVGKIFGAKGYWGHATCHMANVHPRMVLALVLHEFGMTRPVVSIFHLPTHPSEKQEDIHESLSRAVSFSFLFFFLSKVQADQLTAVTCNLSTYSCQKPSSQRVG